MGRLKLKYIVVNEAGKPTVKFDKVFDTEIMLLWFLMFLYLGVLGIIFVWGTQQVGETREMFNSWVALSVGCLIFAQYPILEQWDKLKQPRLSMLLWALISPLLGAMAVMFIGWIFWW